MKYIKGHLKKNMRKWLNKEWYFQRFDGSPYSMFLTAEGEIATHLKRKDGTDFDVRYVFFENDHVDWYILMDDIERISKRIISLAKKNPDIGSDLMDRWKKDEELYFKKCIEIVNICLKDLPNERLIKLHGEFMQLCINRNSSSSTIDGFALGTDNLLADKIKEAYNKSGLEEKFGIVFSILTAPSRLSYTNEAELSLLKIALEIEKNNLKKIFALNKKSIIEELKKNEKIFSLLDVHQKSYFWLNNNYVAHYVLDINFFIGQMTHSQNKSD